MKAVGSRSSLFRLPVRPDVNDVVARVPLPLLLQLGFSGAVRPFRAAAHTFTVLGVAAVGADLEVQYCRKTRTAAVGDDLVRPVADQFGIALLPGGRRSRSSGCTAALERMAAALSLGGEREIDRIRFAQSGLEGRHGLPRSRVIQLACGLFAVYGTFYLQMEHTFIVSPGQFRAIGRQLELAFQTVYGCGEGTVKAGLCPEQRGNAKQEGESAEPHRFSFTSGKRMNV